MQESRRKSRNGLCLFIFLGVSCDLDIATFMLPAPCLALLGPFFIGIMKTALLALMQFFIVLFDDFDHV